MTSEIVPIQVGYNLGKIQNNLAEVRASVEKYCDDYKNVVVTEDSVKDGKNMLANIRKEQKALGDQRKAIKKAWNAPYTEFEKECKEVEALYNKPIELINEQLEKFEEDRKKNKMKTCKEIFESVPAPEELTGWFTFDTIFDTRWLNSTVKESAIKKELETKYSQMIMSYNTIKSIQHEFEEEGIEELRKSHDLQQAMWKMANLLETKKQLEAKAKAEEERRKAEEAQKNVQPEEPQLSINVPDPGETAQVSFFDDEPIIGFNDIIDTAVHEPSWFIEATVTNEKDMLIATDFLRRMGINFSVKEM